MKKTRNHLVTKYLRAREEVTTLSDADVRAQVIATRLASGADPEFITGLITGLQIDGVRRWWVRNRLLESER